MNIKSTSPLEATANLLGVLSHPARLRILLAIGQGEACVCHLEAVSGYRQAYISQHLMALREADLLSTRREGRYIFYRLAEPNLLALIRQAGALAGVAPTEIEALTQSSPLPQCCCPNCVAQLDPASVE